MSRKITLGKTEFDLDNPDHKSLLIGMSGRGYDAKSYFDGVNRLRKVFDIKQEIDNSGERPVIKQSIATLNYDKMNNEYVESRFPNRPFIQLDWKELKIHLERFSEGGVDSAEMVMRRLSEIYN